ncbi:OPT oligopeptide transporter protein-domain-containing protein [Cladochytrium replicatum]|nr:OPT oligopeptide transporter protein-domain-containing protein [Cladochytrium replicatum]
MADSDVKTPDAAIAEEIVEEKKKLPSITDEPISADAHAVDDPDAPQLTVRSVVVGCLLGTLISASNFYLGLKLGWTFGAGIFGSIFGYTIILLISSFFAKLISSNVTFISFLGKALGRPFNAREHATLCSAATASGSGTLAGYISGIPAMYRLGLLSTRPSDDYGRLFVWAIAASLYGIFFAVPLRQWFVLKQDLPFPSPRATAVIIQSVNAAGGAEMAKKKTLAVFIAFGCIFSFMAIVYFVPVVQNWHIFYWLALAFPSDSEAYNNLMWANKWNFYIQWTFAFVGAGMMTPGNTVISLVFGTVLAWGIIGPLLYSKGVLTGPASCRFKMDKCVVGGKAYVVTDLPSARYWLLWVGVFLMLAASFTELFSNWRTIASGFKALGSTVKGGIAKISGKATTTEERVDEDPAPVNHRVPAWAWVGGLVLSVILSVVVLSVAFGVGVGESILAIICGFLFAFIGLQSSGETDINPTGTIAKTSQVVLAAVPPYAPAGPELAAKQTANLASGLLAAAAAHQSVDMVSDLKTGHLVGASPRAQFYAQLIGSIWSSVVGLGVWALFTTAYPCITNLELDDVCLDKGFSLTAVQAWYGITLALTKNAAVPSTSLYTAIGAGLFTVVFVVLKNTVIPKKYHSYLINLNAVGIAFTNTDSSIMFAIFFGWLFGLIWKKVNANGHEHYMYAVAAGLIAGEGVFGVVQAIFAIAGVESATDIGMPV